MRRLAVTLCVLALALACAKATRENYDRIQTGMSYSEVIEILGEPTTTEDVGLGPFSAGTASWEGPDGTISIQFLNKKVQIKQLHPKGEDKGS